MNRYRFASDDGHRFQIWTGEEDAQYLTSEGCDPLEIRKWMDGKPITTDGCIGQLIKEQGHSVESLLAMLKEHHLMVMACAERLRVAEETRQECLEQLAEKGVCITEDFFKELEK